MCTHMHKYTYAQVHICTDTARGENLVATVNKRSENNVKAMLWVLSTPFMESRALKGTDEMIEFLAI